MSACISMKVNQHASATISRIIPIRGYTRQDNQHFIRHNDYYSHSHTLTHCLGSVQLVTVFFFLFRLLFDFFLLTTFLDGNVNRWLERAQVNGENYVTAACLLRRRQITHLLFLAAAFFNCDQLINSERVSKPDSRLGHECYLHEWK